MQHSKQHHNNLLRSCQISFKRLSQFHLISTTDLVGNTLHRKTHNGKALLNIFHLHVHLSSFSVLGAQRARKLFAPSKTRGHGCLLSLDLWRSPLLLAQVGKRPHGRLKIFAFSNYIIQHHLTQHNLSRIFSLYRHRWLCKNLTFITLNALCRNVERIWRDFFAWVNRFIKCPFDVKWESFTGAIL